MSTCANGCIGKIEKVPAYLIPSDSKVNQKTDDFLSLCQCLLIVFWGIASKYRKIGQPRGHIVQAQVTKRFA
jgi:hypothetical protein